MDKKMENEMETGEIQGLKELNLSYYIIPLSRKDDGNWRNIRA